MSHIINYINQRLKTKKVQLLFFTLVLLVFIINTFYVSYPDEFVNILAGKFINSGKLPYKEFFDHHLPLAWYLAALLLHFSSNSYVVFRIIWAVFSFIHLLLLGLYLEKKDRQLAKYYWVFFLLFPFVSVYFWLHLFLADSLAFLYFSIVFWLLISQTFKTASPPDIKIVFLASFVNFLLVFSSLTYIYLALTVYGWLTYLFLKQRRSAKDLVKFIIFSSLPYILFLIYLILTGSFKDFYIANFIYNTKLYISIPNYTRGKYFNPLKFALTLIYNFHNGYFPLLTKVKEMDLFFPINVLLGWGSFLLLLIIFTKDKTQAAFYFLILSFSAPRSNVYKITETDYQSAIFISLGIISSLVVFYKQKELNFKQAYLKHFQAVTVLILFTLTLFSSLFLIKNTYDKFYLRYTQKMPGIYDLSDTANFLNEILHDKDYYWIGPYEPDEIFFVRKGKLPGKYISLLPQFREDKYFREDFLKQFKTNPPKIIIFKHQQSIFMTPADKFGQFFLRWIKGKYINIKEIKNYKVLRSPSSFNIDSDLYILKKQQIPLLKRLTEKKYIQPL